MITYLDTSVAVWVAQKSLDRLTPVALDHLARVPSDRRISPAVLLELQFLREIGRIVLPAADVRRKLEAEFGVEVCNLSFAIVAEAALGESWTRDPFDRLIAAHARANGLSWLVTSDRRIREAYPRAVW